MQTAVAVDVVTSVMADQPCLLHVSGPGIVGRLFPAQPVRAAGHGYLPAVSSRLKGDLETSIRVGVFRIEDHRYRGQIAFAVQKVDGVIGPAAVVFHQSQLGFLPIPAVLTGGIAEAVQVGEGIEAPAGHIPNSQLIFERNYRTVEAGVPIVRGAGFAAFQDDRRLASGLPRNHVQPEPGAEGYAVAVERKKDGFLDHGIGWCVSDFDHR